MRAGAALSVSAAVLLACASSEEPPATPAPQGVTEVTGRVTVTGSEPFVLLVIVTDAEEEYELVGEPAEELRDVQQQRVTVRGRVVRPARGPGFSGAVRRRLLHLRSVGVGRGTAVLTSEAAH